MAIAEQVLHVARTEIGDVEIRGNRTKYGAWYGMDGNPWCAFFVSWVANVAGATTLIPRFAWTPSGAQWLKTAASGAPGPDGLPRSCRRCSG